MNNAKDPVEIDSFKEAKYTPAKAAAQIGVSKSTMFRLLDIEMTLNTAGITYTCIGPKAAQGIWTISESALRRIYTRMEGGFYGKKEPAKVGRSAARKAS
jgi:hypothetical protein